MKRTKGEVVFNVINIIVLSLVALICLYPVLYVLLASFSDPMRLMGHTGILYKPIGLSMVAYEKVFTRKAVFVAYGNTFFYVIVGTSISLIVSSLYAFVLSRKGLYWNKFLSIFALITMYFGGGIVPTYMVVKNLGMLDTRWAILLPSAVSTYNMIIMRAGFASVPYALEEAAEIDGASPLRTFFSVVLPLAMPTVAVIALYYSVTHWNAWFNASIYLKSENLFPLQLYLRQILIANNTGEMASGGGVNDANALAFNETIKYATIIVSVIPILCVYPFIQKYFTKGVMIGAVKE